MSKKLGHFVLVECKISLVHLLNHPLLLLNVF